MKILVVGGGGREHAIVWKLAQNKRISKIYCAPGNGGISALAECVAIQSTDIEKIVGFAKEEAIDLVVVAQDDPLVLGMVDALQAENIVAFGPTKNAAIIEGSKVFSKQLMQEHGIPTAKFSVFDSAEKAKEFAKSMNTPIVVKAEGLALGKGVIIAETHDEAMEAITNIMEREMFGESGRRIVIEEFLKGREVTIMAFTDGKTIIPMPSVQDHKRALDLDKGLNTGGMGAFSPSPIYTDEIADYCMKNIFIPTVNAMNEQNRAFSGILYFGLMITENGVYVVEYNARFGDPEAQVVLPLLKTDLLDIIEAIINKKLDTIDIQWQQSASVCLIAASGGYPLKYSIGYEISGLDEVDHNTIIFHSGTKYYKEKTFTSGGRVLGVNALAQTLPEARDEAYKNMKKISFKDMHYRTDILKTL